MPSKSKFYNTVKSLIYHASGWRDFFIDLIFPVECLGCGEENHWLCPRCFATLPFKPSQYCLECKKPNRFGEFCPACRNRYHLNGVWIAGDYENPLLSSLIKNLKYRFIRNLASELGQFVIFFLNDLAMRSRLGSSDLAGSQHWRKIAVITRSPRALLDLSHNLIVPVPLHKKRLRWRGFNQAELIAQAVAGHYYWPVSFSLERHKHKKPQAKLSEAERLHNIKGVFRWTGGSLENKNIILVDDVVTTGATLNECARVLKQNGAGEIWGLVVAKG